MTTRRIWGPLFALTGLAVAAVTLDGGLVHHRALAGPLAIASALRLAIVDGPLILDAGATLARTLGGVVVGGLLAVPLGLIAGCSRRERGLLEPSLDFLRAIPPLLVLPLALFALGYGELSRVTVVAWATALVVALHLSAASAKGGGERDRALRAMGASRWQRLVWLELPELVPTGLLALRHALSLGLVVAVVTEMVVGTEHGLGVRAVEAQLAYDTPALYAVLFVTGGLGWLAGRAVLAAESRTSAWRAPERS